MNRDSTGIRLVNRSAVERCLQVSGQAVICGLARPRHTRGRHCPSPKLADHLFPRLRPFGYIRNVQLAKHESCGTQLGVVADDAVLVEDSPIGCGSRRISAWRPLWNPHLTAPRQRLHMTSIIPTPITRTHSPPPFVPTALSNPPR